MAWIKLSERQPALHCEVLLVDSHGDMFVGYLIKELPWRGTLNPEHKLCWQISAADDCTESFDNVTHWMPLPEGPT